MRRARAARPAAVLLGLLVVEGCGGCDKAPALEADGGEAVVVAQPVVVTHAPTGLELVAPATWRVSTADDVERLARERVERLGTAQPPELAPREGTIADLRRTTAGQATLATPRLVVVARAVDRPVDLERALDRETDGLRALQAAGTLSVQRTSRSRRLLGGVDMGELRVDYTVTDPRGGPGVGVVHRAWLAGLTDAAGSRWELALVITFLTSDEDLIAREVEDVLKSTHFAVADGETEPN
jgi:hypothetical protein